MGICSRKQAERLIEEGLIKVDGQVISRNTLVNDQTQIEVKDKRLAP